MPLELYRRRCYSRVNFQTPKRKNTGVVARFCVAPEYDRLEKYLLRILSRGKTKDCFDSGVYIWSKSQKRRLATSIIRTLRKKAEKMERIQSQNNGDPRIVSTRTRCIEVSSFVLALLANAPRSPCKKSL